MSKKKSENGKARIEYSEYDSALELLFYEGNIAWQMNLLFIALNVGIGTIIQDKLTSFEKGNILLIIMSVIGLIVNFFWLGTFRRNNKYYHFRMAQARDAEPEDWNLLRKRGYDFSKGRSIDFKPDFIEPSDVRLQLSRLEKFSSNKLAIGVSIWIFLAGFALLFLCSVVPNDFLCKF